MYFLSNYLFVSAPLYIPIVTAFCMAICWYYAMIIIFAVFNIDTDTKKKDTEDVHLHSTMVSVVTIATISTISLYFNFRFRTFFHICFWFIIVFVIVTIIRVISDNKGNKKSTAHNRQ